MSNKPFINVALAAGAAFALSGCVAAAIPIIAGGAMTRTVTDGKDARLTPPAGEADAVQTAQAAPQEKPATKAAPAPQPRKPAMQEPQPDAEPASAPMEEERAVAGPAQPDQPPAPAQAEEEAADKPRAGSSFEAFVMKERARTFGNIVAFVNNYRMREDNALPSAILADRAQLTTKREMCSAGAPQAIVFDLDPEGGLFDPRDLPKAPPIETNAIESLRAAGIRIVWISANPLSMAQSVRTGLRVSGLDPAGADRVLLLRDTDDRKQTLRAELAEETCLIAIAGDTKSDFDELYDYLLDPADARSLEPLIGDGWFILPSPPTPTSAD